MTKWPDLSFLGAFAVALAIWGMSSCEARQTEARYESETIIQIEQLKHDHKCSKARQELERLKSNG